MMQLADAILTDHAVTQMATRQLSRTLVEAVLQEPEQIMAVRAGRIIAQAVLDIGEPARKYLVRVVVDIDRKPPEVVTAYKTSRIEKYRNTP